AQWMRMDDDALELPPVPPDPQKGDILFRGDLPDGNNNAVLNSPIDHNRYAYSEGYRRGARLLVQYVAENHLDQDFLVYPIVFLYRHHVELVLKDVLKRAPGLTGRSLTAAAEKHLDFHDLVDLWSDVQPVLADIWEELGWGEPNPDCIAGI